MKFVKLPEGYTRLDKIKHKGIRKELNIYTVNGEIYDHRKDDSLEQNGS
jgi:hypothetical protein